jgi:hypothetical protein
MAQIAAGGAAYFAVVLGPYRSRVMKYVRFFLLLRRERKVPVEAIMERPDLG